MGSPEDPNKFLKLIDLDLERRRNELPASSGRSIFMWRAIAAAFLVGAAVAVWWLFDFANSARDEGGEPPANHEPVDGSGSNPAREMNPSQ